MDHKQFFNLIKKGLPSGAFVLHGEEEYVKAQAVRIYSEMIGEDFRPFNLTSLSKPTVQELAESCETLPLFADRRVVVLNELEDGEEPSKYVECFKKVPDETLLLAVFKGTLAANSSLLKLGEERTVVFKRLLPNEIAAWCVRHFAKNGVLLPKGAALLFVRIVGDDMANVASEADKLIDYVGAGGTVTAQDVSVCIRTALDVRIFDMLDMFTYGKPADGMIALHSLIDEGNEPMSISAFLVSRFKLMLEARRGIDMKRSKREVVSAMEGNRYANEKAFDAAMRFTSDELIGLIADLSDTSFMKIKGVMREDKYLELVLLKHNWRQFPV